MREDLNLDRRRFFGKAAMTVVAAELGTLSAASAQSSNAPVAASANDGSQQTIALALTVVRVGNDVTESFAHQQL
jgi:nitrous oxide reductase